jgi:glycosyltransferase involved in cell wall biosynthesis
MRVCVVRNAAANDFGGAERLAVYLARELGIHHYDSYILTAHKKIREFAALHDIKQLPVPWWRQQNWSGWRVAFVPLYLLWLILVFVWYMAHLLRHKPDVLHLMSKDDFIAGTYAGKLLKKRIIWTDCADLKFLYRNIQHPLRNPVGKLLYHASRHADAITLVSNNEKQLIEQALGAPLPANYLVVYMVGRDEAGSVKPVDREQDTVVFCATSRLVVAKGIGELIDSFRSLDDTRYRLWIIGDGPDREQFAAQAAADPRITLFGHQTDPLPFVAAADIYVHPTYHEGFSLSLAEAAMLSKPMIATNVGGNPELVNDKNGILVNVQDTVSLSQAMGRLAADPVTRQQMGAQARHDYAELYDFAKIVPREILPLYD